MYIQGDRPFCCPMPNCRRRFSTEQEVKKHIDNHMNPHSSKGRKRKNINNNNNNNNNTEPQQAHAQDLATIAAAAAHQQDTKGSFLTKDMQNNVIPRMTPGPIKHELYFPPQCYGPPFNQNFNGTQSGPQQQQQVPPPATTQSSTTGTVSAPTATSTAVQ